MDIVLEKKKNRGSKVLPRRARLMEDGFHQQNNKVIPYPNGFNIIHKNEFDQLSQEEKNFMPWTANAQSTVRVFFCRQNHQISRSQINQFQKPTAVYFADKETGQRFIDFLQFRGINREKRIEGLKKIGKRWLYQVFNTFMIDQQQRLRETSNLHNQARQKKLKGLMQCPEIVDFDQSICKNMMSKLLLIAQKRKQIEDDLIKQKKVIKMKEYIQFFKQVEGIQVNKLISLWLHQAQQVFDEIALKEEEEQRRIQQAELEIQVEIDQEIEIEIPQQQQFQDNHQEEIKEKKFDDVHLQNFRLLLDPTITLIKPIFVVQFKNKESRYGKIIVEHCSEQLFQNLQSQELVLHLQIDQHGWFVDLKVILEYYGLRDILEFSIYDELRDITDRQVNLAQEQEHQLKTFLVQTNKLMQGQIKLIEIQKNLHNNRRHYAQLNISGDFQAQYYQDQSKNIPVIQFDIYEQDPFNVEMQVDKDCLFVHPHYLDIMGMPLLAHEIKHLQFKQFQYPLTDKTMIWRQLKIDLIEKALNISGQSWADSKWSNDYLIEAQEYLEEIEQNQQNFKIINLFPDYVEEQQHTYISKYNDLANYLYQEEFDDVLAQILIKCGLRGFSVENRLQLMPILLKSTQQIINLAKNYQIAYTLNEVSILQQFTQQADEYLDENIKQQNKETLDQYLESFQNISAHIFGSQLNKKLVQKSKQILDVCNASYLINSQIQIPLVVTLFRLLDQPSNEEGVFILLQSLQFDIVYPQLDLNLNFSPEMLFTDHLKNLFSDFFRFDIWLRVLDYVIAIGFISGGHYPKVLASVIGGIFQSKEFKHRTIQELQAQLKLYGKLQCDPDLLINNSYHCFQTSQFYTLQQPEKLTKLIELGVDPINQIIKDQKKFDPNEEVIEEFYIDVPEEHQDSICRELNIHYDIPTKINHQFVQKFTPKSINLMIHQIQLHSITYGNLITTIKYGEQQLNNGNYHNIVFDKNYSEIFIHIEQGQQIFEQRINIHNYPPNIIHKEILILNDNYQMQRNYTKSQIEFSILISNQSEEQNWKSASVMNYPDFKQFLSSYFKIDPSKFDFQGIFKEQSKDQSLYLVDFMVQFILNSNQEHQVKLLNIYKTLNLFSPVYGDGIYFPSLRQMINYYYQSRGLLMQDYLSFLPEYEVRFIKVTIIDDQCEILIDLTDEFNQYLIQNLINYNSYNLDLIDGNNKMSLLKLILEKSQKNMKDTKSQLLILRLKYITFQEIKKQSFPIDKQLNVPMGQIKQANNLQQQFENNAYILKMDNQFLIKFEQFKIIMDQLPLIRQFQQLPYANNYHLAQIRGRGAVKQMVTCEIVGLIKNKIGEIQYYVIEINKKTQIVYKESVCFLSTINEQEIVEMQKPWKK